MVIKKINVGDREIMQGLGDLPCYSNHNSFSSTTQTPTTARGDS